MIVSQIQTLWCSSRDYNLLCPLNTFLQVQKYEFMESLALNKYLDSTMQGTIGNFNNRQTLSHKIITAFPFFSITLVHYERSYCMTPPTHLCTALRRILFFTFTTSIWKPLLILVI